MPKPGAQNTTEMANKGPHTESSDNQAQSRVDSHDRKTSKPDSSSSVPGREPEPQRQVDDVTPKLKRRQPQVADAYR